MSMNGTAEAEPEVLSPLGAEVQEILAPLLAKRDQLEAEESDLTSQLAAKREEVKTVNSVLRSAKMIAPKEAKPRRKESAQLGTSPRSVEAFERIVSAIESFDGEPFQISMVEEQAGTRTTISKALSRLHEEGRVRLLGNRTQISRPDGASGGRKAATYQEIR